ncbi:thermonuclease family protein [Mycoplasma sp. E35C]|uniref:thermonuclease family protein n=1 Tax=Mycoplasma sp. E35C TaxID=2801918 RepID=UPI001CA45108|nr:thermonuclease family protein [Mycoplasma sp. E35C]QZX49174.1 thermonuclease family protein [Mycoplasma sp. E35C]
MKFKKIMLFTGLIGVLSPIISSCGNSSHKTTNAEVNKLEYWEDQKNQLLVHLPDYEIENLQKAQISYWRDGDTPEIILYNEKGNLSGAALAVRIQGIDTPEKTRVDNKDIKKRVPADQPELKYAELASQEAESLLPKGTDVWFRSTGGKSYDRLVGTIYYDFNPKEKTAKNFSAYMVEKGLAIPLIDNVADLSNKSNGLLISTKPIAIATNIAVLAKRNIWSEDENLSVSITKVYKIRGASPNWINYLDPDSSLWQKYAGRFQRSVWEFYKKEEANK